jgi:hypothetical protein
MAEKCTDGRQREMLLLEEATELEVIIRRDARESKLYIDNSRGSFISSFAKTVVQLVHGNLENSNRFRKLLLGMKGVGKTSLLKSLNDSMQKKTRYPNLLSIYVNYSIWKGSVLPSDILTLEMESVTGQIPSLSSNPLVSSITKLCDFLKSQNM